MTRDRPDDKAPPKRKRQHLKRAQQQYETELAGRGNGSLVANQISSFILLIGVNGGAERRPGLGIRATEYSILQSLHPKAVPYPCRTGITWL